MQVYFTFETGSHSPGTLTLLGLAGLKAKNPPISATHILEQGLMLPHPAPSAKSYQREAGTDVSFLTPTLSFFPKQL